MTARGFVISGTSPDGTLVELIELKDHPWFLACQFHPEFKSQAEPPAPDVPKASSAPRWRTWDSKGGIRLDQVVGKAPTSAVTSS